MSDLSSKPELTVLTCTHNPRADILELVLDALTRQTLPSSRWEFLIVDNNSNPPVDAEQLNRGRGLPVRVIRESEPGVAAARRRGTGEAAAEVIVMVDDDNIIDPDYLEVALEIARAEPALGAFGGIARPRLEVDHASPWQGKLLGYLGIRDYGTEPITSCQDKWGEWEPIGAGMVLRREVARRFIEFMASIPQAVRLGRRGKGLLAGEDSLLARASYRLGYSCSYQPRLKMTHFIKAPRLKFGYLFRLLYGHGRSVIMLEQVLGKPAEPIKFKELINRFFFRYRKDGLRGGLVMWAWDLGYYMEGRAQAPVASANSTEPADADADARQASQLPH